MLRYFENLYDPYQPYDERAGFPTRLVPFVWQLIRPARWILLATIILAGTLALAETALAYYAGRLVDQIEVSRGDVQITLRLMSASNADRGDTWLRRLSRR